MRSLQLEDTCNTIIDLDFINLVSLKTTLPSYIIIEFVINGNLYFVNYKLIADRDSDLLKIKERMFEKH